MGRQPSLLVLLTLAMFLPPSALRLTCTNVIHEATTNYHMVAPCSRSTMMVTSKSSASTLKACSEFAKRMKGLAFSFPPEDVVFETIDPCLVYECPEFDILSSIKREANYDYYSLYANPLPTENTTCVPGIGVFHLHRVKANYTTAIEMCREEGGELAHVIGEKRTNSLSRVIANSKSLGKGRKVVYVGLNDMAMDGRFVTTTGKLLTCFVYRAWAPGEPRHRATGEDCVVLDDSGGWRVVDCKRKLPFLCEILQNGPLPKPDDPSIDRCDVDLGSRIPPKVTDVQEILNNTFFFRHWVYLLSKKQTELEEEAPEQPEFNPEFETEQ